MESPVYSGMSDRSVIPDMNVSHKCDCSRKLPGPLLPAHRKCVYFKQEEYCLWKEIMSGTPRVWLFVPAPDSRLTRSSSGTLPAI